MAIGVPSESPAIIVKEVDLTGGVPNVQSTTAAFVGDFNWGPVNDPTLTSNEAGLVSTFTAPTTTKSRDFLTASYFLKYSNALQVVRVGETGRKNATWLTAADELLSEDSLAASGIIQNFDNDNIDTTTINRKFVARYPGGLGNSIKIAYADSGAWGTWPAAYKSNFDDAPAGNERHILVMDADGTITGTTGTVLEKYEYLSTSDSAVSADGSSKSIATVINRASNWVWVDSSNIGQTDSATLSKGSDGDSSPTAANYITGYDLFSDKDTVQVDFLVAPGSTDSADNKTIVDSLITTASSTRKDCVVVNSPAYNSVIGQSDPVSKTNGEANNFAYTSYQFMDNNWLKVYDKYNDVYSWIPAASSTAGIMAASDANSAPWFSPAGSRRGGYLGVTSLAYTPTKSQRDTLYKAGVNPIANLPGQGILLYGDKTHMNRPSAFDRINVRRLFNVVERAIALAARNTLFELNDEFTRAEFVNIVEPFLREIKGRRGITDFRVVCDETNNTAAIIDRNEFIANIFIKPARSINYITLNFVAVRSGVDFEEVAGLSV